MEHRAKKNSKATVAVMVTAICGIVIGVAGCETAAVLEDADKAQLPAEEKDEGAPTAMAPTEGGSDLTPIDLTLVNANIDAIKARLAALGVAVDIDPALSAAHVSLDVKQLTVVQVIGEIAKQLGGTAGKERSTFTISAQVVPLNPPVPAGTAEGTPSMDKEVIRKVIHANIDKVNNCYQRALAKKPSLQGRITVKFTIQSDGSVRESEVADAEDTMNDKKLIQCVVDVVKDIEFPAPKGGGIVIVSYPFWMSPPEK